MEFSHAPALRADFPELAVATLWVDEIDPAVDIAPTVVGLLDRARSALDDATSESELPPIRAWRRVFSRMGLKPTQYRCASEALLRRLRTHGDLPSIHPLVDIGNAVSAAYAIPIAAIDLDRVVGDLVVQRAIGAERYLTFAGEIEHPEPGEVIYADDAGNAHARRWTNRQSGLSAVRPETRRALLVAEAVHSEGSADVARLRDELATALRPLGRAADGS